MKDLKTESYKNVKEKSYRKKVTTYFKMYITNVISNISICLSVFSEPGFIQQFMVLKDSRIYLFFKCSPFYFDS